MRVLAISYGTAVILLLAAIFIQQEANRHFPRVNPVVGYMLFTAAYFAWMLGTVTAVGG